MLETNGIQPRLEGHVCEELICQQYWYNGKKANDVDVLSIKADGRCYQLYFDSGVVFWRNLKELPTLQPQPQPQQPRDTFSYPLVDMGNKYHLKNRLITGLHVEPLPQGAKVTIEFEKEGILVIYHQEDHSEIRLVKG